MVFLGNNAFSQNTNWYYFNDDFDDFQHQHIYYETSPKGLKEFIRKTKMDNNLKNELLSQVKKIESKKTIGNVIVYSSEIIGGALLFMSYSSDEEHHRIKTPGFIIFAGGTFAGMMIKPKKKNYLNFFNTYNKQNKNNPISISLNFNPSKESIFGIALIF